MGIVLNTHHTNLLSAQQLRAVAVVKARLVEHVLFIASTGTHHRRISLALGTRHAPPDLGYLGVVKPPYHSLRASAVSTAARAFLCEPAAAVAHTDVSTALRLLGDLGCHLHDRIRRLAHAFDLPVPR